MKRNYPLGTMGLILLIFFTASCVRQTSDSKNNKYSELPVKRNEYVSIIFLKSNSIFKVRGFNIHPMDSMSIKYEKERLNSLLAEQHYLEKEIEKLRQQNQQNEIEFKNQMSAMVEKQRELQEMIDKERRPENTVELKDGEWLCQLKDSKGKILSQIVQRKPSAPITEVFEPNGKIHAVFPPANAKYSFTVKLPWNDDMTNFEISEVLSNLSLKQIYSSSVAAMRAEAATTSK